MWEKILNNRSGSVLVIVVIIFMILSIFSVAVLNIFTADNKHAVYQDNKMQAYYFARSGADALASYIINNSTVKTFDEMQELLANIDGNTSSDVTMDNGSQDFLDHGSIEIKTKKFKKDGKDKLEITSTGIYKDVKESVTVTLDIEILSGGQMPALGEYALHVIAEVDNYSDPAIEFTGGSSIEGNAVTNAAYANAVRFAGGNDYSILNGSLSLGPGSDPASVISTTRKGGFSSNIQNGVTVLTAIRNYTKPDFPDFPQFDTILPPFETPWVEGTYYPITEDAHYAAIKPSSNRTITIDLAGGNRIIRVGDLDLREGEIKLNNVGDNGRLILYVDQYLRVGNNSRINKNGDPSRVLIYYSGNNSVTIGGGGDSNIAANFFIKSADLHLPNPKFHGNIITLGTNVTVSGNGIAYGILYAPNAHVEIHGSGQINGSVVANTFRRPGGQNPGIKYTPIDNEIPGDFFGNEPTIKVEYDENPWK